MRTGSQPPLAEDMKSFHVELYISVTFKLVSGSHHMLLLFFFKSLFPFLPQSFWFSFALLVDPVYIHYGPLPSCRDGDLFCLSGPLQQMLMSETSVSDGNWLTFLLSGKLSLVNQWVKKTRNNAILLSSCCHLGVQLQWRGV